MRRREVIQFVAAAATACAWQANPATALLRLYAPPAKQDQPEAQPLLPLFPLPLVLFPGVPLPLHIFEERYKEMVRDCLKNRWEFGILLAREERVENIGCTASISEVLRSYHDGRMDILVHGRRRFEISLLNREKPYLRGQPEFFEDTQPASSSESADDPAGARLRQQAITLHGRLMKLLKEEDPASEQPAPEEQSPDPSPEPPSDAPDVPDINAPHLSFEIMSELPADPGWKQTLLELRSERERLVRVADYLQRLIQYLEESPSQGAPANRA